MEKSKTVIVTGASQGIGAGAVRSFFERGYNVVAASRTITQRDGLIPSARLTLVDGDIGQEATANKVAETAVAAFGSIDALVKIAVGMGFGRFSLSVVSASAALVVAASVSFL